jgi:dihydroorotate dehydrogenase (NAD+) catalytic subunit
VIGCGGVTNWRDAVEFMLAGASAVEVGTAIRVRGFGVYKEITTGIEGYLEASGFRSVKEIVGLAQEAV